MEENKGKEQTRYKTENKNALGLFWTPAAQTRWTVLHPHCGKFPSRRVPCPRKRLWCGSPIKLSKDLQREDRKKKSSAFLWEEYYIASPSPESVLHWVECSFPAKQGLNSFCFHCVTLHEATMQNNQQKGASGDTDASTNCLRGKKKPKPWSQALH